MRFLFVGLILAGFAAESQAGPLRRLFGCQSCSSSSTVMVQQNCTTTVRTSATVCDGNRCTPVRDVVAVTARTVANVLAAPCHAIDQVNALRAQRGMRAYVHDEALTQAAVACATARAQAGIQGHTRNDFQYLPAGVSASCAGCAAWPVGMGFGACAIYERYTYCGAATVIGPDGRAYHHAFYR